MSSPVETEIKIAIPDGPAAAARLLEAHGYRVTQPRTLQVDQVFDFADGALRRSGQLLRVRSEEGPDGGAILTFKGPAVSNSPHKSREELETRAGSRATLESILERLGFVPSFRYEKYRTTYRLASGEPSEEPGLIAIDETPIGVYLELEGPPYWIDGTAESLGFRTADYVTASYAALYKSYLASHDGPSDMIFLSAGVRSRQKNS